MGASDCSGCAGFSSIDWLKKESVSPAQWVEFRRDAWLALRGAHLSLPFGQFAPKGQNTLARGTAPGLGISNVNPSRPEGAK